MVGKHQHGPLTVMKTNNSLLITNGQEAHTYLIAQCVSRHAAHKRRFGQYLL